MVVLSLYKLMTHLDQRPPARQVPPVGSRGRAGEASGWDTVEQASDQIDEEFPFP